MWDKIREILHPATQHTNYAGKLWYLMIIVFRIIVVSTVGTAVYSDEQSEFRCSTEVIGCNNVCFDKFSKISHIRFWAFQLMAVLAAPALFHFYAYLTPKEEDREKSSAAAKKAERNAGNGTATTTNATAAETAPMKVRSRNTSLPPTTTKQKDALTRQRPYYLASVFLRGLIETISLYIACTLFSFAEETVSESYQPLGFIFIKIPQIYICTGVNVERSCGQHIKLGERTGYVPCWVSRPWEKTIFMSYMNVFSMICLILCCIEFVQLIYRHYLKSEIPNEDQQDVYNR